MMEKLGIRVDVRARRIGSFRLSVILLFFFLATLFIVARLAELQIINGPSLRQISEKNSLRDIPIRSIRSEMIDRNGKDMAVDVPQYKLFKVKQNGYWDEKQIGFAEASAFEENGTPPGQYVESVPTRYYPMGEIASHLTGYVGEISPEELKHFNSRGYKSGDRIGKSGLEKQYELRITGDRGRKIVLVNSRGKFIRYLATEPPRGHAPFRCTIDSRLQTEAYNALKESKLKGAVLFMDSFTGEIIVLATYPSFDNNVTSSNLNPAIWSALFVDPAHPLLNRAISVSVPLGSVFKLAVATAALEEGIVKPDTVFHCPGGYRLGRTYFHCWTSHGSIKFVDGIAQSCDVVFYTLGHELGVTRIRKYAKMLGLGKRTGIDLPGESIGNVPDSEWKKRFRGSEWYEGDTISYSIGQGYIQVSPVQALEMANVFATRGLIVTPHLSMEKHLTPERSGVSEKSLDVVRAGMRKAVLGGTCAALNSFEVPAAGKTGTAQDIPRPMPHAWFVGFAPFDKPRLTFAVFAENGGHGASVALPVAARVLKLALKLGYFGPQYKPKQAPGATEQQMAAQAKHILD